MKIMWTNRWSSETGFVKEIQSDHFVNTYDKSEGANFKSRREADKAIENLYAIGEGLNNMFDVVTNR